MPEQIASNVSACKIDFRLIFSYTDQYCGIWGVNLERPKASDLTEICDGIGAILWNVKISTISVQFSTSWEMTCERYSWKDYP
jgi:hypothetical protein